MAINLKHRIAHSGLTIIEVMTSIVVAMIGVMGVMILVPFAVRQAQTGLDTEAAAVVARNAYAKFEIGGYRNYTNWVRADSEGPKEVNRLDGQFPRPYSIDPLGILESAPGGDYSSRTFFPYNRVEAFLGDYPGNYQIPSVNLRLPGPTIPLRGTDYIVPAMVRADARRMFREKDDLIFKDSENSTAGQNDAQLNGPMQSFDTLADGTTYARRQSAGRFSWSMIAVPNVPDSTDPQRLSGWVLSTLVYKDRDADVNAIDSTPVNYVISPKMRVCRVLQPTSSVSPVSSVRIRAEIPSGSIKKDEWIMLVNRLINPIKDRPDWQIKFYRIVNFQQLTKPSDRNHPESLLTLDGPDFNFDTNFYQPTCCVHLKNVVAVFERTIVPEGNSVWNIAY